VHLPYQILRYGLHSGQGRGRLAAAPQFVEGCDSVLCHFLDLRQILFEA